jgi:hypothetical protein
MCKNSQEHSSIFFFLPIHRGKGQNRLEAIWQRNVPLADNPFSHRDIIGRQKLLTRGSIQSVQLPSGAAMSEYQIIRKVSGAAFSVSTSAFTKYKTHPPAFKYIALRYTQLAL